MDIPESITDKEGKVLDKRTMDEDKINEIETQQQAKCDKWKDERSYRLTASRFHLIRKCKRNHETFAQTLMHQNNFPPNTWNMAESMNLLLSPGVPKIYDKYENSS